MQLFCLSFTLKVSHICKRHLKTCHTTRRCAHRILKRHRGATKANNSCNGVQIHMAPPGGEYIEFLNATGGGGGATKTSHNWKHYINTCATGRGARLEFFICHSSLEPSHSSLTVIKLNRFSKLFCIFLNHLNYYFNFHIVLSPVHTYPDILESAIFLSEFKTSPVHT